VSLLDKLSADENRAENIKDIYLEVMGEPFPEVKKLEVKGI